MKTKKNQKMRKSSIILAVVFTVAVCYFFISFFNIRAEVSEKKEELSKLQLQAELLEEENSDIALLLAEGDVDEFVEKRARSEEFGYVMPGERVYYDLSAFE
ncbi:MAG: septum formation initiator family protein [Clostridia bacterium]|nr:septum formation initiator family protein [Clostridia bacterium]